MRVAHAAAIADRVLRSPAFLDSASLLTYLPMGAEVDPTPVADVGRARGMTVLAPTPDADAASWTHLDAETRRPGVVGAGPVFVIVPGVGFDADGGRLGRGLGFYDRALRALRATADEITVVGVAFDCQIVPELPRDPWDEHVDLVVTETRVIVTPRRSLFRREVET
jgi:5-formyltetrahydrofolate cyclo-ligase